MEPDSSLDSLQEERPAKAMRGTAGPLHLESLPWDLIEVIASYLCQSDFASLSRVSKTWYKTIQPLLWRHPRIADHAQLTLFANFLNRPPVLMVPSLDDWDRTCRERCARVKQMTLRLDPGVGLNELASDLLHKIAKHCPDVAIKLFFDGKLTQRYMLQDPRTLFPRVKKLVISKPGSAPDPRHVPRSMAAGRGTLRLDNDMEKVAKVVEHEEVRRIEDAMREPVHPCLRLIPSSGEGGGRGSLVYAVDHDPTVGADYIAAYSDSAMERQRWPGDEVEKDCKGAAAAAMIRSF